MSDVRFALVSPETDGGVAHFSDTANAFTSGKLFSFRNQGAEKSYIEFDGKFVGPSASVDFIQFNTGLTPPAFAEGQLYWDADDKTLLVRTEVSDVTLQVGQEQHVRTTNKTGAQIDNGTVVYVNGAQGNRPTITSASAATQVEAEGVLGITTHDIADNATGYVTTFGLVRDLNTLGIAEGAPIYLSTTTGEFTDSMPAATNTIVRVGIVLTAHVSQGIILFNQRLDSFNGVVGGVAPADGSFTTLSASGVATLTGGFTAAADCDITKASANAALVLERTTTGQSKLFITAGNASVAINATVAGAPLIFSAGNTEGFRIDGTTQMVTVTKDLTVTLATFRANFATYYWSAPGDANVVTSLTYVKVSTASSTTAGEAENFTVDTNNRATYTGLTTQKFRVSYHFTGTTTDNNVIAQYRIAKNGTVIAATDAHRQMGPGADEGSISTEWIIELATNDYVELWGTSQSGDGDVGIEHGQCTITEA